MRRSKKKLMRLICRDCLKEGNFALAAGGTSDYFIDLRLISVSGKGASLIGKVLYHQTKNTDFQAIGGLQVGAVPLVTATVAHYWNRGSGLREGFWVRPEKKDHGTEKQVEGKLLFNSRVIIVEDVCTTGGSASRAVQVVQDMGNEVVLVLALVDREQGAREKFREMRIPFESVFTARQLRENARVFGYNTVGAE